MTVAASYREWKSWTADSFAQPDDSSIRYYELELARSGVALGKVNAVLEIGFGNGGFAGWARARGWTYAGTELDTELVARARKAGFDVYCANAPVSDIAPGNAFDAVLCFDVLEHLTFEEIVAMLSSLRARLAPGGRIIARFPNGDSPFGRLYQYGDITHKTVIGSGIVQQACLQSGLRLVQLRAPVFPVTGLGFLRAIRRSAVVAVRAVVDRVVRIAYFDNRPSVTAPNLLVVLQAGPAVA